MKADLVPADCAASRTGAGASIEDAARESDLTFVSIRHALTFAGRGVRVSGGGQSDV
ncbi:hypothetical protein [Arenimonas terrae]|jgi:hypothetical protein|uniref:hypothetical protein n=1 Tax=Arenimonas terrae TaxID=2546226 RepID=UPI00159EE370|nr:hypothetical protein [Arenimonas terrae]